MYINGQWKAKPTLEEAKQEADTDSLAVVRLQGEYEKSVIAYEALIGSVRDYKMRGVCKGTMDCDCTNCKAIDSAHSEMLRKARELRDAKRRLKGTMEGLYRLL